jgi:hypothetical protein
VLAACTGLAVFDEAGAFFKALGPGYAVRSSEVFGSAGGRGRVGVLLIEREAGGS